MKQRILLAAALVALGWGAALAQEGGPAKWLENFEKKFPPVKKNVAAENVERLALGLGIDWRRERPDDERPTKEDLEAQQQSQAGPWLDAQCKTSGDSIAPPPPRLSEYLDKRRSVLSRIAGVLQKDVPEWGYDIRESGKPRPELLRVSILNRILVAAALVEEHAGRHVEAGELLDASWSLYSSLAWRPDLLSQLVAIGLAKNQLGALRRLSEPPFAWLDRVAGDAPQQHFLDVLQQDPLVMRSAEFSSNESLFDVWARGTRAVADNLRQLSPCQISTLSADEIWLPMGKELHEWKESGTDTYQAVEEVFKAITTPNLVNALRRQERLLVDRELTLKILELRQEKAASRDGRWPERFLDTGSLVCPEASFEYRVRGGGMSIRFRGEILEAEQPGLLLPLSFEARAPQPTPTPKRPARVTPRPIARS